jgi:predicted DNA-binding ribbon-helix-helix protein
MGKKVAEDSKSEIEPLPRTDTYLVSGNLVVSGHRTSVRLEEEMWAALNDVAERKGYTVHDLASRIHGRKKSGQSFTSAIRVYLILYYRNAARDIYHPRSDGS